MRCARAATAGLVNVSRRRAIGHRAHRNKTVKAKRATAIARRDTVTTSAAREVRIYAALLLVETANPLSGIARAHWGTKPGTGRPTILYKFYTNFTSHLRPRPGALYSYDDVERMMHRENLLVTTVVFGVICAAWYCVMKNFPGFWRAVGSPFK